MTLNLLFTSVRKSYCDPYRSGQLDGGSFSVWFTSARALVSHRKSRMLQNDSQGPIEPVPLLAQLHYLSLQVNLLLLELLNLLRQVALCSFLLGNHPVDCGGQGANRHSCGDPLAREERDDSRWSVMVMTADSSTRQVRVRHTASPRSI